MEHSATAVATEMARRFGSGDLDGAFALFADDVVFEQPASLPHGGRWVGRAGMSEMGARFGEHWTRTIGEAQIFGDDKRAVQVTPQTWTSKVTGRSATVDVAEIITAVDGVITEIRVFQQDTAALLATLN
jgi:ketosteroid isomerase-like protein